jgi:hypothetical protein
VPVPITLATEIAADQFKRHNFPDIVHILSQSIREEKEIFPCESYKQFHFCLEKQLTQRKK